MDEPTILEFLQSLLSGRGDTGLLSRLGDTDERKSAGVIEKGRGASMPSWVLTGALVALAAQYLLEPPVQHVWPSIILYAASALILYKNVTIEKEVDSERRSGIALQEQQLPLRRPSFYIAMSLLAVAFLLFRDNQFTWLNFGAWILGLALLIQSFWIKRQKSVPPGKNLAWFTVLVLFALLVGGFFRFYRLAQVPAEMFSDHAEKLQDVMDVLEGETRIFFPRNTGREGLQFYLTAAIVRILGTGISFLSLKIGTALAGFLTLPFIYLIGKTLFNKWVGLIAMVFTGFSYWHNVISRIGLRFPFYPLFAAISLFYLVRGIKQHNRNDVILSGLFTGMGLHGYSPFRIMLVLIIALVLLVLWFEKNEEPKRFLKRNITVFGLFAFAFFLPLFRYMLEDPGAFHYRALSRMTSIERSIDGSLMATFLGNLWKSLVMVFYRNGVIWVNSIPDRPALDFISGAFFFIGLIIVFKRILASKRWEDIFLVLAIPILMLPSILSLAYPQENPALNRSSGAVIPVFIICAVGFYQMMNSLLQILGNKKLQKLAPVLGVGILAFSALNNYELVFSQFDQQFKRNAWNTSEIGQVIADFANSGNNPNNAFVIPYPHWVDTRLVGINAGFPRKDYALWPEFIGDTQNLDGAKLFIIKPEDTQSVNAVELVYPEAEKKYFHAKISGKDFLMMSVNTH